MSRDEIREYLARFAADRNRGCTIKMWCRDLAKCTPQYLRKIILGAPISLDMQARLSEAIEGWKSGKYSRLRTDYYEHIGLAPDPVPKMRKNMKITLGPNGPSLSCGIANRRDYTGDLK